MLHSEFLWGGEWGEGVGRAVNGRLQIGLRSMVIAMKKTRDQGLGLAVHRASAARLAGLVSVLLTAGAASGQTIIEVPLPPPEDAAFSTPALIQVSGDGNAFAVSYRNVNGNDRSYRWIPTLGLFRLDDRPDGANTHSSVLRLNHDGSTIGGRSGLAFGARRGAIWQNNGTDVTTPEQSSLQEVLAWDRTVTVFAGQNSAPFFPTSQPVIWPGPSVFRWLGLLPGHNGFGLATDLGVQGDIAVGMSSPSSLANCRAFRWSLEGGMEDLGAVGSDLHSIAWACTDNGTVVIGNSWATSNDHPRNVRGFRWVDGEGMAELPPVPGTSFGYTAWRMNADGSVAVGRNVLPDQSWIAAIWTEQNGTIPAADYFASFGLDLTGWVLERVTSVDALGQVFVGLGRLNDEPRFWAVDLSPAFPPVISLQPVPQTFVDTGSTVVLSVGVSLGTPPIEYQWRRNGQPITDDSRITGAMTDTLEITTVGPGDTDEYDVVVTNDFGQVTSTTSLIAVRQTCPADFDADGVVTVGDYFAFLTAFFGSLASGCP